MFENPRRGMQARNFTRNVPKILAVKSSSEQIFSENCRWVPLVSFFAIWFLHGVSQLNVTRIVGLETVNRLYFEARNHAYWPSPFQLITSIDRSWLPPKSILLRRGLFAWSKHGHTCLAAPDFEPACDITVCMDVARNPWA